MAGEQIPTPTYGASFKSPVESSPLLPDALSPGRLGVPRSIYMNQDQQLNLLENIAIATMLVAVAIALIGEISRPFLL